MGDMTTIMRSKVPGTLHCFLVAGDVVWNIVGVLAE